MMTAKTKAVLAPLTLLLLLGAGILYAMSDPGWPGAAGETGIVELPASERPPVEDGLSDEGRDPMPVASPSIAGGRREPVEPVAKGGIQGRVVDQLSEPMAGAELFLYRTRERERGAQAQVVASARSNPRGEFRMRGLDHGLYSLRAVREGSVDSWARVLINEVSPLRLGLTLQLRDGYPLSGRVVDPDGKPLVGACVLASVPNPVDNRSKGSEVRTDRKGRFAFASLPRETLQVLAWSEGYALGLVEAEAGSARPLRIVLQRERSFSISFSLSEPKKVLGEMPGDVTIEARYFVGNATVPLPSPIRILSVPPKGKARFSGLREGQYLFLPRSQQVAFEHTKIRQALRRDEPVAEISLGWSARLGLDVRFVDPVGKPVMGVLVSTPSAIDHVQRVVRSDKQGRVSFENLFRQGAEVALAVETPGFRFLIGKIPSPWMRCNPGGAEQVLTLTPFPFLSGRVVDEKDGPVPGAEVWLRSASTPASFGRTRTDVHGEFHLSPEGVSQEPLVLDARRAASYCEQPLLWESLDPASLETVVLRLVEGASINGRIVDDAGNGIPGVWAFARLLVRRNTSARRDPQRRAQRPDPRALSDRSGRFRIIGLEPGAWRISASMEGGIRVGEAPVVKIQRGEKSAGLRLVLARGLCIQGQLVDDRGTPLAGTHIGATLEGGSPRSRPGATSWTITGPDGRYTLAGLLAGRFELRAQLSMEKQRELGLYRPGPDGRSPMTPRRPYVTLVRAGTKNHRWQITTPRFGDLRLQLAHDGDPLPRIRVVLISGDYHWSFALPIAKGVVSLKRVLAGSYQMTLEDARYADLTVPVEVKGGQLTDLGTLALARLEEVEGRVVDQEGNPLSGVWIGVDKTLPRLWHRYEIGDDPIVGMMLTKSDTRGRFRIPVKADTMVFGFKPGYTPASCASSIGKQPEAKIRVAPQQDMVLVLNRAGEVLIQASNLAKGQRAFWRYRFDRLPVPERTASKAKRPAWACGKPLEPGKPVRLIGLAPGRYRLQVANFEKVRAYRKKTVPGESYYEEFQVQLGTNRVVKIP